MALTLLAGLCASRVAGAQALSMLNDKRGVQWPPYHADPNLDNLHINQVNQRDCVYNPEVIFNFTLGTTNTSALNGYEIEAWIGTSCDQNRNPPSNCVQIGATSIASRQMKIPVRAMIQALQSGGSSDTGGTGGTGGTSGTSGAGGTLGSLLTGGTGGTSTGGDIGTFTGGTGGDLGTGGTATGGTSSGLAEVAGLSGTAGLDAMGGSAGLGTSGSGGMSGTDGSAGLSAAGSSAIGRAGGTSAGGTSGATSTGGSVGVTPAGTGGDVSTGGTSGAGNGTIPSECEGNAVSTTPNDRTIFFMILSAGDGMMPSGFGSVLKWAFKYDLVGPQAPAGVTAGIGEDSLVLKWSEASNVDTDLYRYQLLCDPPPNQPGGEILGAAGAADESSSQPSDGQCYSPAFSEGSEVTADLIATYNCGIAQKTSTNAEAQPLTNFVPYAIGVVAQDDFKNYGKVSNLACGTPEPVTDFYEAYRMAGGRGGGGFCSIIGAQHSQALTALSALAALGLIVRRRAPGRSHDKDAE
jgi:hypothetical protein